MTLSDRRVKSLLRNHFVCVRENIQGDPNAGSSFAHPPGDPAPSCIRGNGKHNVQILVLTPDGRILHALSGFISPQELVGELRFARRLYKSLSSTHGVDPAATVTEAHEKALREIQDRKFTGPLGSWEKRRALADHRFVAKHPLLPARSFRSEMLVGKGKSFFGSSKGKRPKDLIGDRESKELFEKLKKKLEKD